MTEASPEQPVHSQLASRIVELADCLTTSRDPAVRDSAAELLDLVDAWHREALLRIVAVARRWRGEVFLDALAADPVVGEVLDAYGLGPFGDDHCDAAPGGQHAGEAAHVSSAARDYGAAPSASSASTGRPTPRVDASSPVPVRFGRRR